LRIENRVIPAGPSAVDASAHAAFWLGCMIGMASQYDDITKTVSFADVRDNFLKSAKFGLDSTFTWMKDKKIPAQENTSFYNSGTVAFQYARYDEVTRRLFEAGGCKLAVVTNRISTSTGIYDLFVDGKDIMYYSTPKEAVEKIEYLLNNQYVRETLAERIYSKVNVYHRAETRAQQIIDIIKSI
jgi:glycosyltransferase involved in cell wall biosynthesis